MEVRPKMMKKFAYIYNKVMIFISGLLIMFTSLVLIALLISMIYNLIVFNPIKEVVLCLVFLSVLMLNTKVQGGE